MKKLLLVFGFILGCGLCFGQGYNHNWLIGYTSGLDTNVTSKRGWLQFDTNTVTVTPDNFKMPFLSAQGNISDENGNLLMVSNGCWIADATGDTMQNGGGLNPDPFTASWCSSISGIPYPHSNIFLPYPNDSNKYVLFHQSGSNSVPNGKSLALYYSIIDMTLNGGLGGVVSAQKNLIAVQDTLNPMLAACKHANGRDWWIIAFEDNTDIIYKILFTQNGISTISTESLGVSPNFYGMGQANFSPDGKKFAYHHRDFGPGGVPVYHTIRLYDFDRCSGLLSNGTIISHTDSVSGNGLAFSSNSKCLFFTLFNKIYQINTDTSNIQASLKLISLNDGYCFPYSFTCTDFWMMYLAANGKIYISSGSSVVDMHFINYPDSVGMTCDVQQHALHLPCYSGRGNVYHPNYYLGCDTTLGCPCLITDINNLSPPDFKFRIHPNPITNNTLYIGYLLPQNTAGTFHIYDITGKVVFKYTLPPWSNEQSFKLPALASGIYNCVITSGMQRVSKKVAVINE